MAHQYRYDKWDTDAWWYCEDPIEYEFILVAESPDCYDEVWIEFYMEHRPTNEPMKLSQRWFDEDSRTWIYHQQFYTAYLREFD